MVDYPAIGEIDDPSNVGVALIVNKQIYRAPLTGIGLQPAGSYQPLDADLTSWAGVTRAAGFDTFAGTPSSANLAALVTDEVGAAKVLFGTAWAAYTPTYTGLGTVTNSNMRWRRVGDSITVGGSFTTGTTTAVEARISLPSGLVANATTVPVLQLAGYLARDVASALIYTVLMESNVAHLTMGFQSAGAAGLAKGLGNSLFASGQKISLFAEIPI